MVMTNGTIVLILGSDIKRWNNNDDEKGEMMDMDGISFQKRK
jgi:hypothetical protein